MRSVALKGANNIRDLGGIPAADGRVVKRGLVYRGSALNAITADDATLLFGKLGIQSVVDLRCGWEVKRKPDLIPNDVEYLHIPYYDLEKVGIEYTRSAAGTKADGPDIACDPDDFYRAMSNPLTVGQMKKGLNAIFARVEKGIPVYQHCSGGKDRSGIMSLLILTVLGVSQQGILDDYLQTNIDRDANIQPVFERFLRLCEGDESKAWEITRAHGARAENLEAFYQAVEARYGGMQSLVAEQLGIDEARSSELRLLCTEPA